MAHEVRNPLAGIRSTAQLWQRGVVGLDEESLGGLVHEVDRLEEIVSRLLQFSRADAQDLIPGDLNAVVAEAARLAEGPAESKAVRLEVDLQSDLPQVAMARSALLQVFRNLTTNAVQAMAAGGTLRLSTRIDPSRQLVLASVDDTGPGLAPEVIGPSFRALLHDQGRGHRTGSGDCPRDRAGSSRRPSGRQPARRAGRVLHDRLAGLPGSSQRRTPVMQLPATVLVADDDRTIRRNLVKLLHSEGYRPLEAANGDEALECVRDQKPDAVLLDLKMPGRDGLAVLAEIEPLLAELPVIVVTALGGSAAAIEAMRRGAYDYLSKPFDLDEVLLTLKRALRQRALAFEVKTLRARSESEGLAAAQEDDDQEPELIGQSAAMREVFKLIGLVAANDAPVLIVGESGTGKELVAAAIHRHSSRAGGPFIRVNCGALPEGLVESELFGHEKGAFTGADRRKPGRFERAAGGTILLDEVGELPLPAQAKILRVLQQHEFELVGGTETFHTDARVISATHRDLSREVAAGRFREDLFYRLNVARIAIRAVARPSRGHRAPGRAHPPPPRAEAWLA